MAGGPSHLESFDYKPQLKALHGKPFPESFTKGQQLAQLQNTPLIARGPFVEFAKHGKSGQEISSLFPGAASIADEIAIVRSMVTEQINHDPAQAFMNSGSILKGRPSMGSWLVYGLGAETDSLPGFVVLMSQTKGGGIQPVSARQWSAGFCRAGSRASSSSPAATWSTTSATRRACRTSPAADGRGDRPAERDAGRGAVRPGDPDPDQPVRDGVQDAVVGPGADRLRERAAARAGAATA
jgi:hypothetical protein